MNAKEMLERLERSCRERGVKLVYDDLQSEGGLCRLRGDHYIIINRRAALETRVRLISGALERIPVRAPAAPTSTEAATPAGEFPPETVPARSEEPALERRPT